MPFDDVSWKVLVGAKKKNNFFYLPQMKNFNLLLSGFPQVVFYRIFYFLKVEGHIQSFAFRSKRREWKNNLWRFLCDDFYAHKKYILYRMTFKPIIFSYFPFSIFFFLTVTNVVFTCMSNFGFLCKHFILN